MTIPTDGYTPERTTWEIHYPWPPEHPVVTLDVTLAEQKNMAADDADALVREYIEALFVAIRDATGEPDLTLLRTDHGRRVDDVTPSETS